VKIRCMLCGKLFEEEVVQHDQFEDDDDYDDMPGKKSAVFCLMCQAKLKHEADNSQKLPKPM